MSLVLALLLATAGFSVFSGGETAATGSIVLRSFRTPAQATVWAVGDGDSSANGRAVSDLVARGAPDRFLYLGDVYEGGTAADYGSHYAGTYGRLASRTSPTPGNHEWPSHAAGYDPYWSAASGRQMPPFYSFSIGGWQLLSLNSELPHDPASAQLPWLRSKLRAPGTCRLGFWHRPRYAEGPNGDQDDVAPLWNALRGHATIVISGHDHDMQRFRPRNGITQFVSGAGGHGLFDVRRGTPSLAFANDRDYGALRLRLRPGLARYAFVAVDGRTLDAGRIRCRPSRKNRR